jgi:hypothetical protein
VPAVILGETALINSTPAVGLEKHRAVLPDRGETGRTCGLRGRSLPYALLLPENVITHRRVAINMQPQFCGAAALVGRLTRFRPALAKMPMTLPALPRSTRGGASALPQGRR